MRILHDLRNEMNVLSMAVALACDELSLGDAAKVEANLRRMAEAIRRSGVLVEKLGKQLRGASIPRRG